MVEPVTLFAMVCPKVMADHSLADQYHQNMVRSNLCKLDADVGNMVQFVDDTSSSQIYHKRFQYYVNVLNFYR